MPPPVILVGAFGPLGGWVVSHLLDHRPGGERPRHARRRKDQSEAGQTEVPRRPPHERPESVRSAYGRREPERA